MHRQHHFRFRRSAALLIAALAGFAVAAFVGIAVAKSFTLHTASNETVASATGTVHEGVVVNGHGAAVYTLTGDTARHPKCTKANACFQFWPPVKVGSAKKLSKAPGIKGKLGALHRNGFTQVTLGGHPLYTYAGDHHKGTATGDGINTFGGIWHVSRTSAPKTGATGTTPPSTSTGTTSTNPYPSTTTTMPYPYPYP
jgi:predicted lipoprotein with Yx(FWY)xxD motif